MRYELYANETYTRYCITNEVINSRAYFSYLREGRLGSLIFEKISSLEPHFYKIKSIKLGEADMLEELKYLIPWMAI